MKIPNPEQMIFLALFLGHSDHEAGEPVAPDEILSPAERKQKADLVGWLIEEGYFTSNREAHPQTDGDVVEVIRPTPAALEQRKVILENFNSYRAGTFR